MQLVRALMVHLVGVVLLAACASSPRAVPGGASAATPAAAPEIERGSFTILRGSDTVAVEHFTRAPDSLGAALEIPRTGRVRYDASLAPDGTVHRIVVDVTLADSTGPSQHSEADFEGDSVFIHRNTGTDTTERRAVDAGTLPYINPSPSLMEQIVRRSRVLGGDSVDVPLLSAGTQSRNVIATVTRPTPDSAVLSLGPVEVRLAVDSAGRVRGGSVPAQGITIVRQEAGGATP
ncbi:MAG TPA: hypothetical protein VFK13_04390 [Gemmatimonadaceae bacterium]|nr:hypothetical protein [Gemmatimonadaceae bacterium]